jgi:hypothetical protein
MNRMQKEINLALELVHNILEKEELWMIMKLEKC